MEKIWLKHYPPGVPHTIDLDPRESLVDILERACEEFSDRPAYSNLGRTITFAELDNLSKRFASCLQVDLGLKPGDRVALMMPNLLQYPIALFGILRAGMVVVSVNPLYTSSELQHQLQDSEARAIVVLANSAATVARAMDNSSIEHVIVTEVGDMLGFPKRQLINFVVRFIKRMVPSYRFPDALRFLDALKNPDSLYTRPEKLTGADTACLQYTGGTTGRSKGATLSHSNLVANVRQINTWLGGYSERGREIALAPLPLYHVYALTCNLLVYIEIGGHNILITDPRNTKAFIAEMKKWRFTAMSGVNTLYQSLVDHPDLSEVDFSSLKLPSSGGMAVMEATACAWSKATGTELLEGYGLSETSPVVCTNPPNIDGYNGSIGLPLPNTDISLRDDAGQEVPLGESGELCVRGPQVMKAYWNAPEVTAACMTTDGYFMTGDIAVMDAEGFFRIVDRKKDMILVSGLNVYPNEVENAVTLHPDVVEAACIGVPNKRSTEAVKVFVVIRPGADVSETDIQDFCRERLAAYKVPKHVEFRQELPKSNVGKILRRALREKDAAD